MRISSGCGKVRRTLSCSSFLSGLPMRTMQDLVFPRKMSFNVKPEHSCYILANPDTHESSRTFFIFKTLYSIAAFECFLTLILHALAKLEAQPLKLLFKFISTICRRLGHLQREMGTSGRCWVSRPGWTRICRNTWHAAWILQPVNVSFPNAAMHCQSLQLVPQTCQHCGRAKKWERLDLQGSEILNVAWLSSCRK